MGSVLSQNKVRCLASARGGRASFLVFTGFFLRGCVFVLTCAGFFLYFFGIQSKKVVR